MSALGSENSSTQFYWTLVSNFMTGTITEHNEDIPVLDNKGTLPLLEMSIGDALGKTMILQKN